MFPCEAQVAAAFQQSDNKQLGAERDELVVIEFSVTVRNGQHGAIVMMLSVTVWSCTDRWSVCWTLLTAGAQRQTWLMSAAPQQNAHFLNWPPDEPRRNHLPEVINQHVNFATLMRITMFWRNQSVWQRRFNAPWQADEACEHMRSSFENFHPTNNSLWCLVHFANQTSCKLKSEWLWAEL